MLEYPVILDEQPEGGFVVTFPDVPEAITQGEDEDEALLYAAEALETALSFYVEARKPLANPKQLREAITSRPWLMTSVGRRTEHAGQTTITLMAMHAEFKTAREALMRVSRLLQHWVKEAAEQFDGKSVWHRCCEPLKQILAGIGPPKKVPAIIFASG